MKVDHSLASLSPQERAYQSPQLLVYGDIREMTLANTIIGGMADGRMIGRRDFRT